MVTNRRLVEVEEVDHDFYVTPPWGTKALILNEKFEGNIWEPACRCWSYFQSIKIRRL